MQTGRMPGFPRGDSHLAQVRPNTDKLLEMLVYLNTGTLPDSRECSKKVSYLKKLLEARVETTWTLEYQIKQRLKDQITRVNSSSRPIHQELLQAKFEDYIRRLSGKNPNTVNVLKTLLLVSEGKLANPVRAQETRGNPSIMTSLDLGMMKTEDTTSGATYDPMHTNLIPDLKNQTVHASITAEVLSFFRNCASVERQSDEQSDYFYTKTTDSTDEDLFKEYGEDLDFVSKLMKNSKPPTHSKHTPVVSVKLSPLLPTVEVYCSVTPSLSVSDCHLLTELLKIGSMILVIKDYCTNMPAGHQTDPIRSAAWSELSTILKEAETHFERLLLAERERRTHTVLSGTTGGRTEMMDIEKEETVGHTLLRQLLGTCTDIPTTLLSLYVHVGQLAAVFSQLLGFVEAAVQEHMPSLHLLSVLCVAGGEPHVGRMVRALSVPVVEGALQWMREGVLPGQGRCWVRRVAKGKVEVWEDEFEFLVDRVPCLLDVEAGKMIYHIGRIRALERRMGLEEDVIGTMDVEVADGELQIGDWGSVETAMRALPSTRNVETLKAELSKYSKERDRNLLAKYQNKSGIMDHLNFLKRTMFMKRGDFIENLLKVMSPILDLPAKEVYFHNVMPLFDDVYKKSSLKNSPDQVLGVKLLEPGEGDYGWDIFCIDYRFPEFLQHIFNPQTSLKLLRLWHFLFKIKRCLAKLGEVWLNLRLMIRLSKNQREMENLANEINEYRNNMSQFLSNLSSYIFTEIVENKISSFMKQVTKVESLDELREETHKLVDSMLVGAFLERDPLDLYKSISFLLNCCFRFCRAFELTTERCLQEIDERGKVIVKNPSQRLAALEVEHKIKRYQIADNFPISSFTTIMRRIWEEYHKSYLRFLVRLDLTPQTRTFSFKFDFNEFHCNTNLDFIHKLFQEEKQKLFPPKHSATTQS